MNERMRAIIKTILFPPGLIRIYELFLRTSYQDYMTIPTYGDIRQKKHTAFLAKDGMFHQNDA